MSVATLDFREIPALWTRRHLLDLESLSAEELTCILDAAEDFRAATEIGADGYLLKPTKFDDLKKLVKQIQDEWLGKKKPARAAGRRDRGESGAVESAAAEEKSSGTVQSGASSGVGVGSALKA